MSLLYGQTLISIFDYWKNHSFDCTTFYWQSDVSAFEYGCQASFSFMATVTVCIDFGAQENKMSLLPLFLLLFAMKWWDQIPWSLFFECWALSHLFHSPLSPSSEGSLIPLCTIRVVSSAYLRLLIFLPSTFIPTCASSSLAFCVMYSAYMLNKQGDNIQPCCIPFQFWTSALFHVWF